MESDPMSDRRTSLALPSVLVLFWATWLTVVTVTNVNNALRTAGVLPTTFAFASDNLQLIETSTAIYGAPRALTWLLFVGVIGWEGATAALLWRGFARLRRGDRSGLAPAFTAAMGLFAAFMLADEVLIAYQLQGGHARFFVALGVTWLIVREAPAARTGA
jgi:hypothetical protein